MLYVKEDVKGREPGIIREILGWIFYIIVILVLTYVIITYVGRKNKCQRVIHGDDPKRWRSASGGQMSYRFQDPKRLILLYFHISMRKILTI